MDAKMKDEIRRRVNSALTELNAEMVNQQGHGFSFSVSDYAGGLTIKLAENRPEVTGFALGAAKLDDAALGEEAADGDE